MWVGEQHALALVGQGGELRVVGFLGGPAVEAHLPPTGRRVERGTGLIATVLTLAGVSTGPIGILTIPHRAQQSSAGVEYALA